MKFRNALFTGLMAASMTIFSGVGHAASDTIRIVTDATFPPMEMTVDGKRTGFDIELTEALAKAMGKRIAWTDIDFKGLIPAVLSGRADAAVSAIYITPERKKAVDFTDSYYAGGLVVLTKKDSPIKTLKDLDGKRVTVQVGTKSVNYLQEHYPLVHRVEVEKNQEMFNLVDIGRADAAVTGKPAAKLFAQKNPSFTVLDEQITTEEYGIAISKQQPKLTQEFNAALKAIKADGTYQKLVQKWFEGKK
jgi:polar amino acid transport system substrate-binding protein